MSILIKYNPVLENQLSKFLLTKNFDDLYHYVARLNHKDLRTAGYLLATQLLPALNLEDYWKAFLTLVAHNSKMFLGTFLKAGFSMHKKGCWALDTIVLQEFVLSASKIDKHKLLMSFLPLLHTPEEALWLLQSCLALSYQAALPYILNNITPVTLYILFRLINQQDLPKQDIRDCCLKLMRKNKKIAYNMAMILKVYFDLKSLPGTFSLRIETYQLSRLDNSYDAFKKILTS